MHPKALEIVVKLHTPQRRSRYKKVPDADDIINADIGVGCVTIDNDAQALIALKGIFNPHSLKWKKGGRPFSDHEKLLACKSVMEGVINGNFGYKTEVFLDNVKIEDRAHLQQLWDYYDDQTKQKKKERRGVKFLELVDQKPEEDEGGSEAK